MNPLFSTRTPIKLESKEYALPEGWINPRVNLIGIDGNAFSILGVVQKGLKRAGNSQELIDEYHKLATNGDYDRLVRTSYLYSGMWEHDWEELVDDGAFGDGNFNDRVEW